MLPALSVALIVAATPRFAVAGLTPLDVSQERADYFTEQLGTELTRAGAQVTTPSDLRSILGLERQRQLLGCSESSCVAEIASALGAEGVVVGQLAKTDGRFRLTAKIISSKSAKAVSIASIDASSESQLQDALPGCARELLRLTSPSPAPWVVLGAGGVAAIVGSVFLLSAGSAHEALMRRGNSALSYDAAREAAAIGARDQLVGLVSLTAGLAAIAAGIVWFVLSPSPPSLLEGVSE